MSLWQTIAAGVAGTVVLTTSLRAASELGLTRMDIPFLLGTAFTARRATAKAVGYLAHFAFGLVFAFAYDALFLALGRSGILLGALFGIVHALFVGTVLVNVLLPVVHPRMGTPATAADEAPLLEPPGFMMLNYGRGTPVITVLAHIAYGAVVGAFAR